MKKEITVLIIDDESVVRYLTKHALRTHISSLAIKIIEFQNGSEGINYLSTSEQLPDVILLDINMPIMNGYEFLDAYSRLSLPENKQPHIYILSTVTNRLPEALSHLTQGQFEKPLSKEQIKNILLNLSVENHSN